MQVSACINIMKKTTDTVPTRQRIVDAALKVFSKYGYQGATTRAIAKEAGVNEVTLFRHFGSKQKLFAEMIGHYSAIPYIEAARAKSGVSLEERLKELSVGVMEILNQRRDLIAVLLSEGPRRTRRAKAILEGGPAQVLRRLSRWFSEARKAGEIRNLNPECIARALMGMFFMFVVFQKILPGEKVMPINPDLAQKTFVEIILRGILPREEPS